MTQITLWQILYFAWIASEILIAVLTRTRSAGNNTQDRGTMLLLWIVITASITACQWISAANPPDMFGGAHWLKPGSLILMLAGLAIRWIAVLSLGKAFSANVAIRESQTLKTTGLYAFVRHPSYSGMLLVFLAIGFHSRNWIALACAVIPTTAVLLYRIHVEELALNRAFEEYAAYTKRTKRLIPGVL